MAAVVVALPRPLRRFSDGLAELPAEADDLMAALRAVTRTHPDLTRHLLDDHGGLRRSVRVYLNGNDVRSSGQLDVHLTAGDRIEIVLALAGG